MNLLGTFHAYKMNKIDDILYVVKCFGSQIQKIRVY